MTTHVRYECDVCGRQVDGQDRDPNASMPPEGWWQTSDSDGEYLDVCSLACANILTKSLGRSDPEPDKAKS
jgi:hypothetical protein